MADNGLEVPQEYLISAAYTDPASAYEAVEKILALPNRPTCILLPDDYACLGAIDAIKKAGLRIPDDISIAGYDGIALSQVITPKLTTVKQNTKKLGSEAARQLIHLIERPMTTFTEEVVVLGTLVKGESVKNIST
jgi:DNA-binding LacI/PurR family transcriptional regulator